MKRETRRLRNRENLKRKNKQFLPRVSVFRSNRKLYVQMIDDVRGVTLASMNDTSFQGPRSSKALQLGESFGKKVSKLGIDRGVFDRS